MWKDVIGHAREIETLKAFIRSGRIPHALLFSGLKSLGKTKVAVEFFKALNCLNSPGDPCDRCRSCAKAYNQIHPDLVRLVPEGSLIRVEEVRGILSDLGLKPFEARYRVIILEPAEMLNDASSNALLKTLEEPPEASLFILVSHKPRLLLPTILSRCQEIRFNPIDPAQTTITVAPVLLRLTSGAIGGVSKEDMTLIAEIRNGVLDILKGGDPLLPVSRTISPETEAPLWLSVIESIIRDIMILIQGGNSIIHEELRALPFREVPYPELERILDCLHGIRRGLKQNLNLKVAFAELLLLLSRLGPAHA